MLTGPYRWLEDGGRAWLYFNYGWVATVEADGTTRLQGWGVQHEAKAASAAQGRRFVERWVKARAGVPGMDKTPKRSQRGHSRPGKP